MKRASPPQDASLFDESDQPASFPQPSIDPPLVRRKVFKSTPRAEPVPEPPPPRAPKRQRRVPIADKPGTRLNKYVERISTVKNGKRFFLGSLDPQLRIYQRGRTLEKYLFRPFGEPLCMTFGLEDEWYKIRNSAGTIEHLDVDHPSVDAYRVYIVPMWVARREGRTVETRWGRRWGIPLSAFDVVTREGVVEIAGTPR